MFYVIYNQIPITLIYSLNCVTRIPYVISLTILDETRLVADSVMKYYWQIFGWLFTTVLCEYCPNAVNSRIQHCVQPVAEYAKLLNNQDQSYGSSELGSAFSLPNMGGRMFNELCKLIAKFNVCVGEYRMQCQRHVTISLIDSSYGYLCNEGYNTFMESAECLMELDRKPSVKRCHDETLTEIETANTETGIAMAAKLDRMCGALNFFSGCVRAPIKHDCGSSAWQVIYRVLKDTTNTLMPACQFTGTSPRLLTTDDPSEVISKEIDQTTTPHLIRNEKLNPDLMITTNNELNTIVSQTEKSVSMSSTTPKPTRKTMRKNIINSGETQINVSSRLSSTLFLFIYVSVLIFGK